MRLILKLKIYSKAQTLKKKGQVGSRKDPQYFKVGQIQIFLKGVTEGKTVGKKKQQHMFQAVLTVVGANFKQERTPHSLGLASAAAEPQQDAAAAAAAQQQ